MVQIDSMDTRMMAITNPLCIGTAMLLLLCIKSTLLAIATSVERRWRGDKEVSRVSGALCFSPVSPRSQIRIQEKEGGGVAFSLALRVSRARHVAGQPEQHTSRRLQKP